MKKNILITLLTGALMFGATGCQQGKGKVTATPSPAVTSDATQAEVKDTYEPTAEEAKAAQDGFALMMESKASEGLLVFSKLLQKNPKLSPTIQEAGKEMLRQDRPEEAIKVFALISAVNPKDASIKVDFAMASNATGQKEKAFQLYSDAITLKPNDAKLFYARAVTLDTIDGRKEEAIRDFSRAIELDSGFSRAMTRRAIIFAKLGRDTEAIVDLDKALEIDASDTVADWNRTKLIAKDPAKAEETMQAINRILKAGKPPEVVLEAKLMKAEIMKAKK